jgi:hypothetical protein
VLGRIDDALVVLVDRVAQAVRAEDRHVDVLELILEADTPFG